MTVLTITSSFIADGAGGISCINNVVPCPVPRENKLAEQDLAVFTIISSRQQTGDFCGIYLAERCQQSCFVTTKSNPRRPIYLFWSRPVAPHQLRSLTVRGLSQIKLVSRFGRFSNFYFSPSEPSFVFLKFLMLTRSLFCVSHSLGHFFFAERHRNSSVVNRRPSM